MPPWERYQSLRTEAAAADTPGPWSKYAAQPDVEYTPSGIGGVEMPLWDRFNTFVNGAVDQIPVVGPALSDFGAGVDAAWASLIEGKPVTKEERLAINRAQEEEYPIENIAGRVTGVVAPFVVAAPYAGASRLLGMTGSIGSRMGFGAASGTLMSGGDGLARGKSPVEAAQDAVVGGLVGGMFPLAEKGVKAGWDALRGSPMVSGPTAKVADALVNRDRLTQALMEARLKDLDGYGVIADLGENVQGQAGALATMPGKAQSLIADALQTREAGKNARIMNVVDALLGPAPVPSQVRAGIKENMEAVRPFYEEAFSNARAVDTSAIAADLDAAIVNLRGEAQSALKKVRPMLDVYGAPGNLDPNPYTLFQTRQAIDGMLQTEQNGKVIAALTQVRQQVDDALASAVPGIKEADARFAELARQGEGLTTGQRSLGAGPEAVPPADLAQTVAASAQPTELIGPSGVAFRISQGARAEIERLIGTTGNDVVALKQALKGDGSWNRQKLATLFGEERADALVRILDREKTFQDTYAAAFGNSKTATTQAAQKEFSSEVTGMPTSTTGTGLIANLITRGLGAAAGAAKTAGNEEAARLLMSGELTPELIAAINQALKAQKASLLAPGAAAVGVTTEKKKPIEIVVRGGNPALAQ
jgi:hypothetical protein